MFIGLFLRVCFLMFGGFDALMLGPRIHGIAGVIKDRKGCNERASSCS